MVSEAFAGRRLAGSRRQHPLVDFLAHLFEGALAFQDSDGIDVHVFTYPAEGLRIGANFQHRSNRRTDHRTPSGRK